MCLTIYMGASAAGMVLGGFLASDPSRCERIVGTGFGIAAALTALMILLFLGSWRSTLVVMISIPLSILSSLVALYFLGETINTLTLGGLALAVGILVDDSTVTIENTHRLLTEEHQPLPQATLHGAAGIARGQQPVGGGRAAARPRAGTATERDRIHGDAPRGEGAGFCARGRGHHRDPAPDFAVSVAMMMCLAL